MFQSLNHPQFLNFLCTCLAVVFSICTRRPTARWQFSCPSNKATERLLLVQQHHYLCALQVIKKLLFMALRVREKVSPCNNKRNLGGRLLQRIINIKAPVSFKIIITICSTASATLDENKMRSQNFG